MSVRYKPGSRTNFGVDPLPSGFDSNSSTNSDVVIPSVGIEDVDAALFNLFDKEIPLAVSGDGQGETKVPIVFASGEKWALLKKKRALRDRNNTLILPLITVIRTTIQQTPEDVTGRGINQQTGELIIKRRLDSSDRAYQALINRLLIPNQLNLANNLGSTDGQSLESGRELGDLSEDPTYESGALLAQNRKNNIYETLVIPAPQFYTAMYDVTIWTQYTQHMNQIVEQLISSFLPQGQTWKLETQKGYWFVATVDGNVYNSDSNTDDMSQEERMIKYKFVVKVPAYVLASKVPGAPVPVRRYVSSPTVSFNISTSRVETSTSDTVDDPFLGSDDPTLPMSTDDNRRSDLRDDGSTRLYPSPNLSSEDPALKSLARGTSPAQYKKIVSLDKHGNHVTKYIRVRKVNKASGETVYASSEDLGSLPIVIVED